MTNLHLHSIWIFDDRGILLFRHMEELDQSLQSTLVTGIIDAFTTFCKTIFQRKITLIALEDLILYFVEYQYRNPDISHPRHITVVTGITFNEGCPTLKHFNWLRDLGLRISAQFVTDNIDCLTRTDGLLSQFDQFEPTCIEIIHTELQNLP